MRDVLRLLRKLIEGKTNKTKPPTLIIIIPEFEHSQPHFFQGILTKEEEKIPWFIYPRFLSSQKTLGKN